MTDGRMGDREVRPVVVMVVVHLGAFEMEAVLCDIWLLARPLVLSSGAFHASQIRTGKHGAQSDGFDGWVSAIRFRMEVS